MTKYTPAVRAFLTFLAAALAAVVATVDDQTVRIVAGAIIAGIAAVGIVPVHVGTVTSVVEKDEPVNVIKEKGQAGYVDGGFVITILVVLVLLVLLLRLL